MCHGRIRRHPEEVRQTAIKRFRSCHNVAHLAREIGIPRQPLYRWIDESEQVVADEDGELVSAAKGRESRLKAHQPTEAGSCKQNFRSRFFQRRLAESQGSTPPSQRRWRADIYDYVRDVVSLQGGLSIERMCQLAGASKSRFYRHLRTRDTHDEEMHVTIANNQRGGIEGRDLSDARALVRDSGLRWPSLELPASAGK
jgi:transposase-like protein